MRFETWLLVASTAGTAWACNGGSGNGDGSVHGPLSVDPPYLTSATGSVRNVIVTARGDQRQAMETASCSLRADLFDAPTPQTLTPTAMSGECAAYPTSAAIDTRMLSWVCAGAVIADYGTQANVALCPNAGQNVTPEVPIDCSGLTAGASVTISSGNEVAGDTVTDLNGSVSFPNAITFMQPTTLGVTTWPASGDVPVEWSSAGAGSALVLVQARMPGAANSVIVCRPHTNGQVTLPDAVLTGSGLRGVESMIRVFSYGHATTMAEAGHTYHLFAGLEAAVLMQPP